MADLNYAAMAKGLNTLLDEEAYEAFLREQSLAKDHSFLLAAITRSNLRPAVRKVLEELVRHGKIQRPRHRPARSSDIAQQIGLYRALRVLDLENEGWGGRRLGADEKRKAAIAEAASQLCRSAETIEKDFYKYEKALAGLTPPQLNKLRDLLASVFKSNT
jgi:hypothetical protein